MGKKVGIICAGDREVAPVLRYLEKASISEKAMLKVHEGTINGVHVAALYSGVCKVNAAVATQILIDTYGCEIIINAGTAGGMDEKLKIFDTVVSEEVAYHDVGAGILTEFHPWLESIYFKADEALLALARKTAEKFGAENKVAFGRMVTGEKFIEDNRRDHINDKFSPLSVDMETGSVAHVCYVNKIPFISIRTITDTADHSGQKEFEKNCDIASEISAEFVKCMLGEMK